MIDLTGGLAASREQFFADRPADDVRDSASFWVWDDAGQVGLPRIGIEAVGGNWDHHGIQVNVSYPDGRAFRMRADMPSRSPFDEQGNPTILGAGPLSFQCMEPFKTWVMEFDGEAKQTTTDQQARGNTDGPMVPIKFRVEATMAVPPWIDGTMGFDGKPAYEPGSAEADMIGGERFEQLFRCTGSVTVDGEPSQSFTGGGLRIKRQGVRKLGEFRGHTWQSAVFPSGKAFGYLAYPPHEGETSFWNEGFIFDGDGALRPARVIKTPWLRELDLLGQDCSFVLETHDGMVEVAGVIVTSTIDVHHADNSHTMKKTKAETGGNFPAVNQSTCKYTWGDEVAYGMMERSSTVDKLVPLT